MAVLMDVYAPFDSGPGANAMESTWRDMMKHMLGSASGVIRGFDNDFGVYADSSGMQVKVRTGQCWMRGHFGKSSAEKTLPIAAAHASLARKDTVVLRADFVDNEIEVDVITGTPSASPVPPSVTQNTSVWETVLAHVDVPAAAVTIAAGNVVDRRVYSSVFSKYVRTATQSTTHGAFADVAFSSGAGNVVSGDVEPNSGLTQFTLLRSGLWQITAQLGYDGPGASGGGTGGRTVQIADTSNVAYSETTVGAASDSAHTYVMCQASEVLPAGTVIKVRGWQNSTATRNILANTAKLSIMWVGP